VERGGHIYFPSDLDLDFGSELGLEPQVLNWLSRFRIAPSVSEGTVLPEKPSSR
jgi:hypothetical protein